MAETNPALVRAALAFASCALFGLNLILVYAWPWFVVERWPR